MRFSHPCACRVPNKLIIFFLFSIVLDKVSAFLPKMKEANEKLDSQIRNNDGDNRDVNVELVDEKCEQHIEMNLHLGVFDEDPDAESDGKLRLPDGGVVDV